MRPRGQAGSTSGGDSAATSGRCGTSACRCRSAEKEIALDMDRHCRWRFCRFGLFGDLPGVRDHPSAATNPDACADLYAVATSDLGSDGNAHTYGYANAWAAGRCSDV
jgi:hypothetical protein